LKIIKYKRISSKLKIITDEGDLYIEPLQSNIIRCIYTKHDEVINKSLMIDESVLHSEEPSESFESNNFVTLSTNQITLSISKEDGRFRWGNTLTGATYLQEGDKTLSSFDVIKYVKDDTTEVKRVKTVDGERNFVSNLQPVVDRVGYRAKLNFEWKPQEAIYGLGQGEEGIFDYRGHNQYLYQHNMRIPIPFLISSEGYGILIDCCSLMTFNDDHNGSYLFMDTVDQLDYYFIAGDNLDDIISGFRSLTGKAAMLPKWAFGYFQSKEAYRTQEELVETVEQYRRRNIPIDCIIQDWNYWEQGKWGDKVPDKKRYPNFKEAIDKIHALNVHTMVSVWPNMDASSKDWEEFSRQGLLLADLSTYDAFNEKARKLYWQQMANELYRYGFDSWWCDSSEPFSGPDWCGEIKREPWERFILVGNEHKKYLDAGMANAYPLVHTRGVYENQRNESDKKRVLIITRSGYPSQQKYGTILLSGDTSATWAALKTQITEGLNLCISGLPYWTLDIGGFFTVGSEWQRRGCGKNTDPEPFWFWKGDYNKGVDDLGYRELYVRWFQYGTFLPVFRAHGTDTPREIWNFGEKGGIFYDTIEKFINLRYLLIPYIYSLAGRTTQEDYTMLRSLLFDFADDPNVKNISDEFMFGNAFLVCPVTNPMYYDKESTPIDVLTTHACYLPSGADWVDYWSGEIYNGGQTVTVPAPLDIIPLFIKRGSIIPMVHGLQYAEQMSGEPTVLKIYPGADSSFMLYDDAGESYGYEKGEYSNVQLEWSDEQRILTIGKRTGQYENMPEECEFLIVTGDTSEKVTYTGEELKIVLD
jgi:alpha-D-xyloside xylohydrolase